MNIAEEIERFIREDLVRDPGEDGFSRDDSLIQKGILDSMSILQLVAFVEDRFSVRVTDDEVVTDNFDSIQAICNLIQRKLVRQGK